MSVDDAMYIFNNMDKNGQPIYDSQWLKVGDNTDIYNLQDLKFNDVISAMWIHPRVSAKVCTDSNFNGRCVDFAGPGVVDWATMKSLGIDNNISSIQTRPLMDFASWKLACCRNEVGPYTDATKCGKYWSQGADVCGSMDCANKLIGDAPCNSWCQKNPIECDAVKTQFCSDHPGSPYCGCIKDTDFAIKQRAEYPMITGPRQCWAGSDCQKADLIDTLITQNLRPVNCPDINAQIQTQNIINSNISNSKLSMNATANNNTQSTPPPASPPTSSNMRIYVIFFIIFMVFIMIIAIVIVLW